MSITSRARSIARTGVKVQRRIVIAQALLWPTLILTGTALGATAAVIVKQRIGGAPAYPGTGPV